MADIISVTVYIVNLFNLSYTMRYKKTFV